MKKKKILDVINEFDLIESEMNDRTLSEMLRAIKSFETVGCSRRKSERNRARSRSTAVE